MVFSTTGGPTPVPVVRPEPRQPGPSSSSVRLGPVRGALPQRHPRISRRCRRPITRGRSGPRAVRTALPARSAARAREAAPLRDHLQGPDRGTVWTSFMAFLVVCPVKWRCGMCRQRRSSRGQPAEAYPRSFEETERSEGRRWQAGYCESFCSQTTTAARPLQGSGSEYCLRTGQDPLPGSSHQFDRFVLVGYPGGRLDLGPGT